MNPLECEASANSFAGYAAHKQEPKRGPQQRRIFYFAAAGLFYV